MAYLQLEEERKTMETKEGLGSKCRHLPTSTDLFCIVLHTALFAMLDTSNHPHMSGLAKIKKSKIGALGKGRGSKETVIINLVKFH